MSEVIESELINLQDPNFEHKNGSHLIANNIDNHPKIIDAIVFLLTDFKMFNFRFFGEFGQYINYREDNSCPTAGVIYSNGKLHMVWNRKFIDSLTQKQALFLFLHEISHLLGNCHKRVEYNGLIHKYANIAHDMVINSNLIEDPDLQEYIEMIKGGYVSPQSYQGVRILEPIYQFITEHDKKIDKERQEKEKQEKEKQDKKGDQDEKEKQDKKGDQDGGDQDGKENQDKKGDQDGGDQDGDGQGGDQDGDGQGSGDSNPLTKGSKQVETDKNGGVGDLPEDTKYSEYGDEGQTIDVHFEPKDKIEKEILERIAKDITDKLTNRGLVSDSVQKMLDSLERKPNNWLSQLKRWIVGAKGIGCTSKTFRKANKYNLEGFRGKRKNAIIFDVILDTSGSMVNDIPKVLGTILRDGIVCNIIQIDTKVQSDTVISKQSDLKNIVLSGFGGTILQPAIDYIISKKQEKRPCVIMTDGYTDQLDIRGIGDKVIILTTGVTPPLVGSNYRVIDCSDY